MLKESIVTINKSSNWYCRCISWKSNHLSL